MDTVTWVFKDFEGIKFNAWSARDLANWAGVLVQWSKLPAWKVGDRGFEPRSGIQV